MAGSSRYAGIATDMARPRYTPACGCPRRDMDKHRTGCVYGPSAVPRGAAGRVAVSPGVYARALIEQGAADDVQGWAASPRRDGE